MSRLVSKASWRRRVVAGGVLTLLVAGIMLPGNHNVNASIATGAAAADVLGQFDWANMTDSSLPVSYTTAVNGATFNPVSPLANPIAVEIDEVNHRMFVADFSQDRVLVYNLETDNTLSNTVPDYVLGQPDFNTFAEVTTQASVYQPSGLAYDPTGNRLFVTSFGANRVMVFDVASITNGENAVNVLGQTLYTTASALTTQAGMYQPVGAAFDDAGDRLFVGQFGNNRVQVFDVASITNGENAIAVIGQGAYTTATAATSQTGMYQVTGVTHEPVSNRLFVAEYGNNRVTVFDVASLLEFSEPAVNVIGQTLYTTATASASQAGLGTPYGTAVDVVGGRLFVAGYQYNRITVYNIGDGITNGENAINVLGQSTYTGTTGATTATGTNQPANVEFAAGRLYAAEYNNKRVAVYDVASITNGEAAIDAVGPVDVDVSVPPSFVGSLTNVYDTVAYRYRGAISEPRGIAVDTVNHRLFVADHYRVLVFNMNASNVLLDRIPDYVLGQTSFASSALGTTAGLINNVFGLAYDPTGNRLFVAEGASRNRVLVFDVASITNGENAVNVLGQTVFSGSGTSNAAGGLNTPVGLAFDDAGDRLFVTDYGNNRVVVYDVAAITDGENAVNVLGQAGFGASGAATTQAGMSGPHGIAYASTGNRLFVSEYGNNRVTVYDVAAITNGENAANVLGQTAFNVATGGSTAGKMNQPQGVAFDADNNRIFVADTTNNRVTGFDVSVITDGEDAAIALGQANLTSSGAGTTSTTMSGPMGVAYSTATDTVYVSDFTNRRVLTYADDPATPILNSISPDTKIVGSADFTVTATGANFVPTSVVRWNGSPRPTTYVSDTELTAEIDADDIDTVGSNSVSVYTAPPGGGLSASQTLEVVVGTTITVTPTMPFDFEEFEVSADLPNFPAGIDGITLFLDGTDPEDMFKECTYMGAPTSATCDGELGPLPRGQYTITARIYGADDSETDSEETFIVQTVTTQNSVFLSRLEAGATAEVTLSYTLSGEAFQPLVMTFPAEFDVLSAFTTIPGCASDSDFTGSTLTVEVTGCAAGTLVFSGATVTNPVTAGNYSIEWTDDEGETMVAILENDQITITASVDPVITFDVGADTGTCDADWDSSAWSIPFGALEAATVSSSDVSGVPHICTKLSTNAAGGAIVSVRSLNAGLESASVPGDVIESSTALLVPGTEGYGLCFSSTSGHSGAEDPPFDGGLPDPQAPFDTSCTNAAHNVGQLTTGSQTVWNVTEGTLNAFARLLLKTSISYVSPPHSDYGDILTFIATATF